MDGDSGINDYDKLESIIVDGSSAPCSLPLEYLRQITNNFSDDRLLGEGGFGKVYKGVLQNGQMIAVKKLNQLKLALEEKQFGNEVYHLMRLKHPNIVRFVVYCYEVRNECVEYNGKYIFAEKQQRLLCLEYLPNRSLDRHLSDESSGHDWHTRYKIIKGICCGVHYLHKECQHQMNAFIIHLDLKPGNILLDDNMAPKVADFGLSRLFDDTKTQTCASVISGSLGYMAPEYLMGRIITTKADIYSLGVMIIEIITGTKLDVFSLSCSTSCHKNYVNRVLGSWRNRLERLPSEADYHQIKSCLEIGIGCIKFNREERPTSKEIMERLDRWESRNCYVNNEENKPTHEANITGRTATAAADNSTDVIEEDYYHRYDNSTGTPIPQGSTDADRRTRPRGLIRRQLSRVIGLMMRSIQCCPCARMRAKANGSPHGSWSACPIEQHYCIPSELSWDPTETKFSFAELEAATKGFASEAKIGEGSFGTVYRGKLPDGRVVAVKRGVPGRFQESMFQSELASLCHYRHWNLVGIVGHCEEQEERLLVYDYMENGALYHHLHPDRAGLSSPLSPVVSSWKQRIKILLDASRGVEYLHRSSMVHGNIKSSNILLDAGLTPRVADFGLQSLMVGRPAMTAGYMDPECISPRNLTVKSDVYAFGVLMLEVLTGKPAVSKEAEGGSPMTSVVDYAVPSIMAGELRKVLDGRAAPELVAREQDALELVVYTALHCVQPEGKYRPAMADIVHNLEVALDLCEDVDTIYAL